MPAMTKQDVIVRLCHLQAEVSAKVVGYDVPNDCVCGEYQGPWMTSGKSLEFIEAWTHFGIGFMRPWVFLRRLAKRAQRAWEWL